MEKGKEMGIRVLSLFDGISCGMVALERAGIDVNEYVAYEIDKYAIKVSETNYPEIKHMDDVFQGDFTKYKGFDLLIGGSPCTYWSIAKSDGKRETTSSGIGWELFSQYVRALKESNCKYFLYENNYSMDDNIKNEITKSLGVEPILINSNLVSAQNRQRYYWTNIQGANKPKDKGIVLSDILEDGYGVIVKNQGKFHSSEVTKAGTILARDYKGFGNQNMVGKIVNGILQRLTPLEYERLQTLPDNYTGEVSNTQRYKAVGNGWTVDVIAHIFKGLKGEFNGNE